MIDLARRVSSRDPGVSAVKQLVFHERVMLSPLNGAVIDSVFYSQVMTDVHGQKMMIVVNY
jgi:hypothetical protein